MIMDRNLAAAVSVELISKPVATALTLMAPLVVLASIDIKDGDKVILHAQADVTSLKT